MDGNGFEFTWRFHDLRDVPPADERWAAFFLDVARWLYPKALGMVKDKVLAEDFVQEVLLKIVKEGASLSRHDGHLSGWLWAVCRNAITDWVRKNRWRLRQDPNGQELEVGARHELGAILDIREVLELYVLVWEEMPRECGMNQDTVRAFLMRTRQRLEPDEVAKRQGVSTAVVDTRFSRACKYLSGQLADKMARKYSPADLSPKGIHKKVCDGELDAAAREIPECAVRLYEVAKHYGFAPDQGATE